MTDRRGEPMPGPVTLPIGKSLTPEVRTSLAAETAITSLATPALAFRELRHPATTGYRYREFQDMDRING